MNERVGLDKEMLSGLKELLGEKFTQLAETFITDSQRRMDLLESAIISKNFSVINQQAHGMKGSCRNIGANQMAEICSQLESLGKYEIAKDLEQEFAAVKQEFAAVTKELQSLL